MKKEYTIDADKWICGSPSFNTKDNCHLGEGYVYMKNDQGSMCCLGQIMKQQGVPESLLLNRGDPIDVADNIRGRKLENKREIITHNPLIQGGRANSELASEAMTINDNETTTIAEKVDKLKELFSKKGIKLRFKNIKKHLK